MTEEPTLYIGLTGAEMQPETFDLGDGLLLRKTYAHLMKPLVLAFTPAAPGKAHPGPWKSIQGQSGYDIRIELQVHETVFNLYASSDMNISWWIVALFRILCAPRFVAPILSRVEIKSIPEIDEEVNVFPLESGRIRIAIGESVDLIETEKLEWVKTHWKTGAELLRSSKSFNMAFQAFDQKAFSADLDLYFLALWSALEALFSPSRTELRFRVSSLIATYLESAGKSRYELHREVLKLYDARSSTVHGSMTAASEELIATHQLVRRILMKAIHENQVPDQKKLEEALFGMTDGESSSHITSR